MYPFPAEMAVIQMQRDALDNPLISFIGIFCKYVFAFFII